MATRCSIMLFSVLIVFSLVVSSGAAKPRIRAEFTKVECINQKPDLIQINCSVNRTFGNTSALFVDFKLSKDVADANITFTLFVKHGKEYIQYVKQSMEYCTVISTIQKQYLVQMIIAGLRHDSNLAFSCPLRKNKSYVVSGFTIDSKVLRSYWPSLTFKTEAKFTVNQTQILVVKTFGQVK